MCEECCTWQHATCTGNFARKHRDLEIAQHDAGLALLAASGVVLTGTGLCGFCNSTAVERTNRCGSGPGYDAKWAVAGAVPSTGVHKSQPLIPPHGSDVCVWCAPRRPSAHFVTKMIRMIGKVEVYPHLRGEELSTPPPIIDFLGAVVCGFRLCLPRLQEHFATLTIHVCVAAHGRRLVEVFRNCVVPI
jgi:hypothetical protein